MNSPHTNRGWPVIPMLSDETAPRSAPRQAQVAKALRDAIREGVLTDGQRLPASRQLAEQLGCSRSVVVAAYRQLGLEGLVIPQKGSGTVVKSPPRTQIDDWRPPAPPRFTFTPGASDLGSFPRPAWRRSISEVTATVSKDAFYYADPNGAYQLRRVLADRLFLQRRVAVSAGNVHICNGTVQAVRLLSHVLRGQGIMRMGVENPGWTRLRPPLEAEGMIPVPINVDRDGLRVDELGRHRDVRAVVVSAAHHFPTGAAMSKQRRRELIDWARERDAFIIEDDYDAEFRAGVLEQQSLQSHDPLRVAYLGTTSKTLSPAMRLSWMALPQTLSDKVGQIRNSFDLGASVIDQLALANLISAGILDRHLLKSRKNNDRKRALLIEAVRNLIPDARVSGIEGGLYITMTLPAGLSESWVTAMAAKASMTLFGLERYRWLESPVWDHPPTVVLGFANMTEDRIQEAIGVLAGICRRGASRES